MKVTTIFLLFAVAVFCVRGNGDEEDEDNEDELDENTSESNSSSNEEEDGKGIIPDCEQYKGPCPKNGDPICGTNNKKYASECDLCQENKKKKTDIEILKYDEC